LTDHADQDEHHAPGSQTPSEIDATPLPKTDKNDVTKAEKLATTDVSSLWISGRILRFPADCHYSSLHLQTTWKAPLSAIPARTRRASTPPLSSLSLD